MQTTPDALRVSSLGSAAAAKRRPFAALYTDSREPSGVGAHMLALADELARHCDLAFVCHEAPAALELTEAARRRGHEANVLPVGPTAWPVLGGWLRSRRPDLFHVHAGIGWEGTAAPGLARRAGVGAVLRTEHLPDLLTDLEQRADYAAMLQDVDARICVSEAARSSYQLGGPAPPTMIRNGVPAPLRAPRRRADTRRALGLADGARAILTVARFAPQKGHAVLLQAATEVLRRRPEAVFLWVGEGALRPELERLAQANGLRDRVRFLGARDDVADLMAASDLFVLPSLFEGLPLALLEALQAELPVVATDAPGTAEVFEIDHAAELAPPGDAGALATAILRVLNDRDLADELADRGQRLVRRHFTARRMGEETLALYRGLLARTSARPPVTLQ